MRVLVTGGAGFIGSHLVGALLDRGDEVAVVDDLSTGRASRLDPGTALHKLSIIDAAALNAVAAAVRPEIICHLAARIDVRSSVADPAGDALVNVLGTVNVLEAARVVGARVLYASSGGAVYGRDAPIPAAEEAPTLPESPYGVAKLSAEHYIGLYNRLHGARHAVLRPANVYGQGQDPRGEAGVITVFCVNVQAGDDPVIYGDGAQTRDFVHVDDVVRAFLAVADQGASGTWNIGTGKELTIWDLARVVGEVAGRPVSPRFAPARAGELLRSAVSVGRAAEELGWAPRTPLVEGIRQVYRWIGEGAPDRVPA